MELTGKAIFLLVFQILGGLALFILGMNTMTDGLKQTAGTGLRSLLSKATGNRFMGLLMGTTIGTLVQSSATSVMLVGFVNAGLMSLQQAVPAILGCNIGTTISMQLISFKLGEYCLFAITIGFILQFAAPHPKAKSLGLTLIGFGTLFLGMNLMSDAIKPHREMFARFLRGIHSDTKLDILIGLGLSAAITGIIQSSGAVIGMCFALAHAGVFTHIGQAFPIVLGAHIGTCATAMLGSIGTNIEARRVAVSHLVFNIINSLLAVPLSGFYLWLLPNTSSDLVRQIANSHSIVMVVGVVIFLPFVPQYTRLIRLLTPTRKPPPEPSFLDPKLVDYPERAIYSCLQELQRVTKICARSFRITIDLLFKPDRKKLQVAKLNEQIVDDIKKAMKEFLTQVAQRHLSRRQAIIIQHLNRCMADVERIGDHIDELCDISERRHKTPGSRFDRDGLECLFNLYTAAEKILHLVIESLNPENEDFQSMAQAVLQARDEYVAKSIDAKAHFTDRVANHEVPPIVGMFFSEYVAAYDRIVKHAKTIALAEKHPYFWIKRKKLNRMAEEMKEYSLPPLSNAQDFLDRLHSEDYI